MTLTLDVPPSVVAKWETYPEEERNRRAQTIIAAIEAPSLLAPATRKRPGVSLEEFTDRSRAYWKEKGFDFDKDLAEARPIMEG